MEESSLLLTINSVVAEFNEVEIEINTETRISSPETQEKAEEKEEEIFQIKKRKKVSEVWNDFDTVGKSGSTSSLLRHRLSCVRRKLNLRVAEQQTKLNFLPSDSASPSIYVLHYGKFDMEQMREAAAHWIMMNGHPFTILEEEGFNLMMKRGMPELKKISQMTCREDCMKIYEMKKKRLKKRLVCVNKRVLSFINILPPRGGLQISDAIFKCMKEWGIENKVFTITVDNASNNDSDIRYMKDTIQRLKEIEDIISNIRESVVYANRSEARRVQFADYVQQLQLKDKKLIRDCKTRWNLIFEMLSCALKFKEVFKMFKERDPFYSCCPHDEEWNKAQKICSLLEAFWTATHIISGSEYHTSNLFLQEVQKIKSALDTYAQHDDLFLKELASKMKNKFDTYWGDCNLLMAIAAVFNPTKKMLAVEFCFPKLYSELDASKHILKVKERDQSSMYNWDDFEDYCAKVETSESKKSELIDYLENVV
ncbi:zinc finger BED domain-containing protein DAYSLEEPER-like [Impatiens glandulifera]|uniref:zinc finger BED domain-containing protein DAYSLEEPER-like n=1 Tax=Impatiens glandulifera TaxID=253017 RepID=UPI001FB0D0AF|nr:zinc finger BED domain-containing protein DAYSLEEPER-like [Impatiens glandulifera]